MRIGLAQINPLIGDFEGNLRLISAFTQKGISKGCHLIIFPELALVGYPPRDLLDRPSFYMSSCNFLSELKKLSQNIAIVCGTITKNESLQGKPYRNTALFMHKGKIVAKAHKRLLPFYDVFDEERYFEPGGETVQVNWEGERIGLTICEDIWNREGFLPRKYYPFDPVRELKGKKTTMIINIAASPYYWGKVENVMVPLLGRVASEVGAPLVYVNQVGGNDELIFQGHSMVISKEGEILCRARSFEEDLVIFDTEKKSGDLREDYENLEDQLIDALVSGLRDYAKKCGFSGAVLGVSGGIDSAVTAAIATLALGPSKVSAVAMPGPYSSRESLEDALDLSSRLKLQTKIIPITGLYESASAALEEAFAGLNPDITEENIQARLRGLILMALSNKFGYLLLSTGNKSELAVGYCTLYGDMNGGLAILGDVPKTLVYKIANRINSLYGWIPERIIQKPPSAELRPNQKDEDSLPPYEILDKILDLYISDNLSIEEILQRGFDRAITEQIVAMIIKNEYKRRQAPPVLKVTSKAFGSGRRMPIAHGYKEAMGE